MSGGHRENGRVKKINQDRGFGFLSLDNGEEIFFHSNELQNCNDVRLLREGDRVDFLRGQDSKNPDKEEAKQVVVREEISHRRRPPPSRRRARSRSPYRDPYRDPPPRPYAGRGRYDPDPYRRDPYDDRPHDPPPYDRYDRGYDRYAPPPRDRGYDRYDRGGDRYDDYYRRPRYEDRYDDRSRYDPPPSRQPVREEGTIKKIVIERDFGFVDLRGEDIFFPKSQVQTGTFESLKDNEPVTFIVVRDPRDRHKWQAQELRRLYEQGTVETLKENFGYILGADGDKIFFHSRHLQDISMDQISEGDKVEFKTVASRGSKGTAFEAQEVRLLDEIEADDGPNDDQNE